MIASNILKTNLLKAGFSFKKYDYLDALNFKSLLNDG